MAVSLHHVVIDAHDLPALARFWAQVLGWRILSEREQEVVVGADATAPVGLCFMPVRDVKTTKNRLHLDLSPDPGEQEAEIERILRSVPGGSTSGRPAPSPGPSSPTPRATSSAWCAPSGPSSTRAWFTTADGQRSATRVSYSSRLASTSSMCASAHTLMPPITRWSDRPRSVSS